MKGSLPVSYCVDTFQIFGSPRITPLQVCIETTLYQEGDSWISPFGVTGPDVTLETVQEFGTIRFFQ